MDTIIAVLDRSPIQSTSGRLHLTLDHENRLKLGCRLFDSLRADGNKVWLVLCGKGRHCARSSITTAQLAMQWVMARSNISRDEILLEEKSRDTVGNLVFTKEIIERGLSLGQGNVIIVTTDFHKKRVERLGGLIFNNERYVYDVITCPNPEDGVGIRSMESEEKSLVLAQLWLDKVDSSKYDNLMTALRNNHVLYK